MHSKAYESEGRGTIERFNRTIVEQFEPEVRALCITSLDEINRLFQRHGSSSAITSRSTAPR